MAEPTPPVVVEKTRGGAPWLWFALGVAASALVFAAYSILR